MIAEAQRSYDIDRLVIRFGSLRALATHIIELEQVIENQKELIKKNNFERERMNEIIREKTGEIVNWKKKAIGK